MTAHDVDYIDLPFTTEERYELIAQSENEDDDIVQDRGSCIRIPFDGTEQNARATANKPRIAKLDELKFSFLDWLHTNKPQLLECKVEKYLHDLGHEILWTPPYAPKLQPIELFWAAGKNNVAMHHRYGMTMREVVKALREGWYGNGNAYPANHPLSKRAVDCSGLWRTALHCAGTIYVPICDGISGEIGDLVIDDSHTDELCDIPIDTLVLDMTNEETDYDEIGVIEEI